MMVTSISPTAEKLSSNVSEAKNESSMDDSLSMAQLLAILVIGIAFWFLAALLVGYGAAAGWCGGYTGIFTFFLTILSSWPSLWLIKSLASLRRNQLFVGVSAGTAIAAMCDGTALTWYPSLYGNQPEKVVLAAAWVLFGAGALLAVAYWEAYRPTTSQR